MKFLVDNQMPPALARFIDQNLGTSAIHVQDMELQHASDEVVWEFSASRDFVLVTEDEDFVSLFSKEPSAGLLWVRLRNCRKVELLQAFARTWPAIVQRFEDGERFIELR